MTDTTQRSIVPRVNLNFDLNGDIPKYWFGGDPFKTRFADALSTLFPEGERYFITTVRAYRDQVTDPQLQADIRDFIRQEGQHGIVHDTYNNRLRQQGIDVDRFEGMNKKLISFALKYSSPQFNVANTAAAEHLTSLMAFSFFSRKWVFADADPRMRAMYAWHAIEEVEHKAVAFDVMQKVAKVGYIYRVLALLQATMLNIVMTLYIMNSMFKADGFNFWQRTKLWVPGLWLLYKPGGIFMPTLGHYFQYFKPGFHPWHHNDESVYRVWTEAFNNTADPIAAGNAVHAAAA